MPPRISAWLASGAGGTVQVWPLSRSTQYALRQGGRKKNAGPSLAHFSFAFRLHWCFPPLAHCRRSQALPLLPHNAAAIGKTPHQGGCAFLRVTRRSPCDPLEDKVTDALWLWRSGSLAMEELVLRTSNGMALIYGAAGEGSTCWLWHWTATELVL